jgi:hypothetical protein
MDLGGDDSRLIVQQFRLADSRESMGSLDGSLGLTGNFNMDLDNDTWVGHVSGSIDTHALGMTDSPQVSGQVKADFNGPYATDFGSITLPEGTLYLNDGRVIVGGRRFEGLSGNIGIGSDQILGTMRFHDSSAPLAQLRAYKSRDTTQCRLNVAFLPETADTEGLAQALTNNMLEDFRLAMVVNASIDDGGLSWRADLDTFAGKILGQDFGQQSLSTLESTSKGIKVAFDLGSQRFTDEVLELPSRFNINGTVPLDNAQEADLLFFGTMDLEQAKNTLARLFGESPEAFLAGFTPKGVGSMDFRVHGPYQDMGLDGVFKIKGSNLEPRGDFPYGIQNLDIDLIFDKRRVEIRNFEGRVLRGRLSASGEATWNNDGIENYQLKTNLDNFQYSYIPEGFQFGGSLDAILHRLPNGKGEIKGTLTANNMEYATEINLRRMILNNTIGSIPSLQNIDFDDPLDTIGLNLDVELRQPWIFDTNLLKVKGNNRPSERIKILGTLANPGMRGGMDLIPGGRISNILPAGDIIVESGSIDFPNPNVLNPVINIQGQIDITPYKVNLNINGPLDSLNITPTSTPTLRQDEIFALLLNPAIAQNLGGSSYNTSSTAAASTNGLASTASGLITNLALASLLEPIRRTLKFDRVSVALRTGFGGIVEHDLIVGKTINLRESTIPLIGSYKVSGDIVTVGGQMEVRFGNLVIHFGASGSRALGVTPSGEVRYSWSSW